jgi:magnesium transporter
MREVVNFAMRPTLHLITEEMIPYYQDVYDHVLRAIEWTESLRDLVSTMLETNVTIQNNRLNDIMKKVTGWAAIIAVPTAVTSFYGQNIPIPGRDKLWGLAVSLVVTLGLGLFLFMLFRRKDWI